ncbi:MAG: acyloxyacyl hydrolase [Bacteroidales bacterium]|nr:acyloxyacyl hydrolase [Bacteroidales bacterium]
MIKRKVKKFRSYILIFILIIFYFLTANSVNAQFQNKFRTSNLVLESRLNYCFIAPHHLEMQIFNKHFPAYEINIYKATFGKTRWEYMYKYPLIGISFWYSDLGNSPYLGSAYAIFPYINFPLTQKKKTVLYFRLGVGLGYLTKKFDPVENYKNLCIGSTINAALNFMFEVKWKITKRFVVSAGAGLAHFSNGTIKTPNFGLNLPIFNAGIAYRLSKGNPYSRKKLLPELFPYEFDGEKSFEINISTAFAVKDMQSEFGKRYYVYTIFGNILKQVSYKSKFGIGFDFSYDGSDLKLLERNNTEVENELSIIKPGISAAYEIMMSKLSLVFNLGMYLGGKERSDGTSYEKLAIKYKISKSIYTNITLKAHSGRADFVAFGLGYHFNVFYY